MPRWLPVLLTAWLLLAAGDARADRIDRQVKDLRGAGSYKERLAAALALSRSTEARAIQALIDSLDSEKESSIRRIAALALGRQIDASTPTDQLNGAIASLDHASKNDKDKDVRATAAKSLAGLAGLSKTATPAKSTASSSAPVVFVNVEIANDM